MGFIYPEYFWLLLLLIPLGALWTFQERVRRSRLARFVVPENWSLLNRQVSARGRFHRGVLLLLAITLSIVAAARPYYGEREREIQTRGVSVLFGVDVSKSMLTRDVSPNRLESAKSTILEIATNLPGYRVGLMPFAGEALLQSPLTTDRGIFQKILMAVGTDVIEYPGTNLEATIRAATDAFERSGEGTRALVLFTDGETHNPITGELNTDEVLSAARAAKEKGVYIFAVGVGTPEGEPVILEDGSYLENEQGQKVVSRLNSDVLRDIADVTGGVAYIASAGSQIDSAPIIRDLQSLEKANFQKEKRIVREERYQWPLALAILCLALEPIISEKKKARRRKS